MTRRLYDEDSSIREFTAIVMSCEKDADRYRIVLDRSAFFPEGGGQDGDRGFLLREETEEKEASVSGRDAIRVLDTQEAGEDVVLICSGPLQAGEKVTGVLDWQFRFDRMQNHSGEHIVSGIIHTTFGYNNVGFHMSDDRMTVDLSGELSEEDLELVERKANEAVWANQVIRTDVYTEEEAREVEFRSKKDLHGTIRVVTIPGADVCACCGTHVKRTGEIGLIKILSHEKLRGGTRIEMACGRWAYAYMEEIWLQNRQVSRLLSARSTETAGAVAALTQECAGLKEKITGMNYTLIAHTAESLKGAGDVVIFAADFSPQLLQKLTNSVMEESGGICISFSGDDENGYKYVAGVKDGDLSRLISDMHQTLGGRGGGRPFFKQGAVESTRQAITVWAGEQMSEVKVIDI